MEFSIYSVTSELRRLWISEFGVGVNKHVMFIPVRSVQSLVRLLAGESEKHRATQEAGAAPLLTLNTSAVSLFQMWVQNQLPIKATKSLRSALELPLLASHSSVSFQPLCGIPLQEGKEGLWRPLWGSLGITCVACHLKHFSTLAASRMISLSSGRESQ